MDLSEQQHLEVPNQDPQMPLLDNWTRLNAHGYDRLHGNVYNHPHYQDGELIFTSMLVSLSVDYAHCYSRVYKLGVPKS